MNKAFVREPDSTDAYCPHCGSQGETVSAETLAAQLTPACQQRLSTPAQFCPSPQCRVVYFDAFERQVTVDELDHAVYPKDPDAPICACFGFCRDAIEQDVREGGVTRTRAAVEKAKSADAQCPQRAANGRSCVAYLQKAYTQCRSQMGAN